jgi:DNA-binding NarL/FixJ family response regulator
MNDDALKNCAVKIMPTKIANKRASVVIVDNDADVRLYLQDVLQMADNFNCLKCFSNGEDALREIPRLCPDLVLMDVQMPGLDGIECTSRLKQLLPHVKVVMVTGLHDEHSIKKALNAGVSAYLIKPFTAEQCIATLAWIIASAAGNQSKANKPFPVSLHESSDLLTERENEIMRCMAAGLLYKEIADKLEISYSAVHKFQHRIFQKLKAGNRTEAISRWRGETKVP